MNELAKFSLELDEDSGYGAHINASVLANALNYLVKENSESEVKVKIENNELIVYK